MSNNVIHGKALVLGDGTRASLAGGHSIPGSRACDFMSVRVIGIALQDCRSMLQNRCS